MHKNLLKRIQKITPRFKTEENEIKMPLISQLRNGGADHDTQKDELIELTTSLPVFTKSNSKASVVSDDSLPELVLDSKFDQNFENIKTSKLGSHEPSLAVSRKDSDHLVDDKFL